MSPSAMYGATRDTRNFKNQEVALGRKFESVREIDDHCRREGLECIGNSMPAAWRERRARRANGELI